MREVISLHIGQAGIQLGNSAWELYCLEHGIKPDGFFSSTVENCNNNSSVSTFFDEMGNGRHLARAVFVDLEPSVLDGIRVGNYKNLFHPDQMINGDEDAANIYARGHYTEGKKIIEEVNETIRQVAEGCSSFQGFMVFHSFGGGTGSGFTSLLMDNLNKEYNRAAKLQFSVYPSPQVGQSVVEPYNSVLTTHATLEHSDCNFLVDNEALFDISRRKIPFSEPSFHNLNHIVAQAVSSITSSIRFTGTLNVDLNEFQTNLVPYPRIHFPLISFAPICDKARALLSSPSVSDITKKCFDPLHQLVKCNAGNGLYMALNLLYRGDVYPTGANSAIRAIKRAGKVKFIHWAPSVFKVCINERPPKFIPEGVLGPTDRTVTMLSNTTAMKDVWARLDKKFDMMFKKKAFVHWYVNEGMEEAEFLQAREDLANLEADYQEISQDVQPDAGGPHRRGGAGGPSPVRSSRRSLFY